MGAERHKQGMILLLLKTKPKQREVTEYRERKALAERSTLSASKGTVEDIFAQIKDGKIAELPLIIKADTQGSLEAIKGSLAKFDNEEVKTRVVHGGTGGITASDISLAKSIGGIIIGFNVRANPQARELAEKEGQEIRYYSIIYDLIDNVKGPLIIWYACSDCYGRTHWLRSNSSSIQSIKSWHYRRLLCNRRYCETRCWRAYLA